MWPAGAHFLMARQVEAARRSAARGERINGGVPLLAGGYCGGWAGNKAVARALVTGGCSCCGPAGIAGILKFL